MVIIRYTPVTVTDVWYKIGEDGGPGGDNCFAGSCSTSLGWANTAGASQADATHAVSGDYKYVVPAGTKLWSLNDGDDDTFAGSQLRLEGGTFAMASALEDGTLKTVTIPTLSSAGGTVFAYGRNANLKLSSGNAVTVSGDGLTLDLDGRFTSQSDFAFELAAPLSGAGALKLALNDTSGGQADAATLTLSGDNSGFTGAITAGSVGGSVPATLAIRVTGAFGGSVASLPSSGAMAVSVRVNYDALVGDKGLRVSSTTIPAALKSGLTLYGSTAFTTANLPLMTFPAGTTVNRDEFTVCCATALDGAATAFERLGTVVNGDGTVTLVANLPKTSLAGATVTLNETELAYTGAAQAPGVTVELNGTTLTEDDYEITDDSKQVGPGSGYTVTVSGKGDYEGTATSSDTFSIIQTIITVPVPSFAADSVAYNGQNQRPTVAVSPAGAFTVVYSPDGDWTHQGSAYTATCTLANTTDYKWSDDTTEQKALSLEITPLQIVISGLTMASYHQGSTPSSPSCTVNLAGVTPTYTYWNGETPVPVAELSTLTPGTYTVRATVADDASGYGDYVGATADKAFTVLAPGETREEVAVPAAVSKPYTGLNQTSGIAETPLYTVTDPTDALHKGAYTVTLTLKDTASYRWAGTDEASVSVAFNITTAENSWKTTPSAKSTQWFTGERPEDNFNFGEATFGDSTKTVAWYQMVDGARVTPALSAEPTAAGNYVLLITVPQEATYADYAALEREIGFTIYGARPTTLIPVPSAPDLEWTGEEQQAPIPASQSYAIGGTTVGTARGSYTATLTLTDTTYTRWADSDANPRSITWKIVKATNAWTKEPALSAYRVSSGAPEVTSKGEAKYGEVTQSPATLPTAAGNHTVTFTVTGTDDYAGLTKTLSYTVGDETSTTTGAYEWNVAADGEWRVGGSWTPNTGYPNAASATATFNSRCGSSPIRAFQSAGGDLNLLSLTLGASAPEVTLDLGPTTAGSMTVDYNDNGGITLAANKRLGVVNGTLRMIPGKVNNVAKYPVLTLNAGAALTVNGGTYATQVSTANMGGSIGGSHYAAIISSIVLGNGASITAEGAYTRAGQNSGTFSAPGAYTVRAANGALWNERGTRAAGETDLDVGAVWEADNGLIIKYGRFGAGATSALCNGPELHVSGTYGEIYGITQYGSDAAASAVPNPLTVRITVPVGGFRFGKYIWNSSDNGNIESVVCAPLVARDTAVTVGSNVKFVVDLSADLLARPNLSSVAIIHAAGDSGSLTLPDLTTLYGNFTLVGANKDEWTLFKDETAQALFLRRKGAYVYDETSVNAYTWTTSASGAWDDVSKWDLWREPNSTNAYVTFGNGYNKTPVTVDLMGDKKTYRVLLFEEVMNLTFRRGELVGTRNDSVDPTVLHPGSRVLFDGVKLTGTQYLLFPDSNTSGAATALEFANGAGVTDGEIFARDHAWVAGDSIVVRDGKSTFAELNLHGGGDADGAPMASFLVSNAQVDVPRFAMRDLVIRTVGAGASLTIGRLFAESVAQVARNRPLTWEAMDGGAITVNGPYPDTYNKNYRLPSIRDQHFTASNGTITVSDFWFGTTDPQYWKTAGTGDKNYFDPTDVSGCVLTVAGANARFRSTGRLALGSDATLQAGLTPSEVRLAIPAGGFSEAPVSAGGTVTVGSNLHITVDLSKTYTGNKFKLIASDAALEVSDLAAAIENLSFADRAKPTDTTGLLTVEGNTLYLNYNLGSKTSVDVPGLAEKPYNGTLQTADVPASAYYDVIENDGGTDVAEYKVLLRLKNTDAAMWSDGTTGADKELVFKIVQAENTWATRPSVSKSWWNVNGTTVSAGALTAGVPTFGTAQDVVVTASWAGGPATLPNVAGAYTVTYAVAETKNYKALSGTTVSFSIYEENAQPPQGPEDTVLTDYVWKRGGDGHWMDPSSWAFTGDAYGYPYNADFARALFTKDYYTDAIIVMTGADIPVKELAFQSGAHAVTLDFADSELTAGTLTLGSENVSQTLKGGTFAIGTLAVPATAAGAKLVADGATVSVGALSAYKQAGATLVAKDGAALTFGSATAFSGANLEADGATVAVTGSLTFGPAAASVTLSGAARVTATGNLVIGYRGGSDDTPVATTMTFTMPTATGFETVPVEATSTGKSTGVVTVDPSTRITVNAGNLTKPAGGNTGYYPLVKGGYSLSCSDLNTLKVNATLNLPQDTEGSFVIEDKQLKLKVQWLDVTHIDVPVIGPEGTEVQLDVTFETAWLKTASGGVSSDTYAAWVLGENNNGMPYWQAYVLGYAPENANSAGAVTTANQAVTPASGKVALKVPNLPETTREAECGITVKWQLWSGATRESYAKESGDLDTPQFNEADLPETGVRYYQFKSVFYETVTP